MTNLVVQLGRETELCHAELSNLARVRGHTVGPVCGDCAEIELSHEEGVIPAFFEELGGAIRALRPLGVWDGEFEARLRDGEVLVPTGPWAVSALSEEARPVREDLRQALRSLVEANTEAHGRELRPAPGEWEVVPAKIQEVGILDRGVEFCLWREANGSIAVGHTVWVFSIEAFANRDMGKPYRPQRRGLLPAKLARQMINLARTENTRFVLDPFCGSGVVLIEGLSLGFEVGGSDNRDEAIDQTRKNLEWFAGRKIDQIESLRLLERIDVRQLSQKLEPLSIDAVAGEGDLGPPIRGKLSRKAVAGFLPRLEELYTTAFAEIRTVLEPGGRVCLGVPFWQPNEGDPMFLNLERRLRLAGYEPVFKDRGFDPFLYRRKDQHVGRALYLLESPL